MGSGSALVLEVKPARKVREGLVWLAAWQKWYLGSRVVLGGYTALTPSSAKGVTQGSLDLRSVWHAQILRDPSLEPFGHYFGI